MPDKPSSGNGVASRLAAFLRTGNGELATYSSRPSGRLLWLHLPDDMPIGPIHEFCAMLARRFDDLSCLLTCADISKWQKVENSIIAPLPRDQVGAIDAFMTHWRPDLLLWADPVFQPRIIQRFKSDNNPFFLINIPVPDLVRRGARRAASATLSLCDKAQVTSKEAAESLGLLGLAEAKIQQVLPISEMALPMPDNNNLRRAMATALGPRQVWCAAHLRIAELSAISNAHHLARKSFPTAVLILVPAAGEDVREIMRILSADGWRVASDSPQMTADRQCEILVTNGPKELGAWYRLSSVSIMGGSLNGPVSSDPFEASALGSAVICGPISFPFGSRYRQLSSNDALVRVEELAELGARLTETLAPDRTAELATKAWTVGSEGVEALNQILELVTAALTPELA